MSAESGTQRQPTTAALRHVLLPVLAFSLAINLLALINTLVKTTTMVSRSAYTDLLEKAQAGDPQAQYELGLRYRSGALEDRVDPDKAMYWLRRAADNGNLLAMKTLAEIYAEGWMNVKKDAARAAYWREKSAGRH